MKRIITSFIFMTLCVLTGFAQSLKLNGSDQYMSISNDAVFFPSAGGEYTVTCKVKMDEWGSNMRFIGACAYPGTDTSEATGYDLMGGNNEYSFFGVNAALKGDPWGNNHNYVSCVDGLGRYVHVAWVFNGPQQVSTTYIDGVEGNKVEKAAFSTAEWGNHGFDILVGAGYESHWGEATLVGNYFMGEIDDVHFYNKALTPEELVQDKESFSATHANLVAGYDFNSVAGNTVPDISGHGHDGLLHGVKADPNQKKYTVTVDGNLEGGYITANLNETELIQTGTLVAENSKITLVAHPYEGYELDHFTVNGETLEGNTYVLVQHAMFSAVFKQSGVSPSAPQYAIPDEAHNVRSNASSRLVKSISIEGATLKGQPAPFKSVINSGLSQTYVYQDHTAETVELTCGDEVKVNVDHDVIWMHAYLYIDYNHDGVFNEDNELVSYSFFDEDNNKSGVNSIGEVLDEGPATLELPKFVVADLEAGVTTRMRYKVDWNSKNPVGSSSQNIGTNNGTIVDFTARVNLKPGSEKFAINYGEGVNGTYWVVNQAIRQTVKSGDKVAAGTELTVLTTPAIGYILREIYVNGQILDGYTFIVEGETNVEATFSNKFWVKFDKNPAHGTVSVDNFYQEVESGDGFELGSLVRAIITPDEGYLLETFEVNGKDQRHNLRDKEGSAVKTWITADVQENLTLKVVFTKYIAPHTITYECTKGGVLRVEDINAATSLSSGDKMAHKSELSMQMLPDPNYEISSVLVNGEEKISEVDMDASRPTFRMTVLEDTKISVTFTIKEGIGEVVLQGVRYDAAAQQVVVPEGAFVVVFNAAGQKIFGASLAEHLSTQNWAPGAYIVRVATTEGVKVLKIIK